MTISPLNLPHVPESERAGSDPVAQMSRKKLQKKGYFFKGFSVDTNEMALASLDEARAKLRMSNIQILDQKTLSKESLVAILFTWLPRAIETKGIAWFEREFAPIVETLNPIVARERALAAALDAEDEIRAREAPEGFSKPKGKGEGKPGGKRKPKGS